jgi:hypothetical protein
MTILERNGNVDIRRTADTVLTQNDAKPTPLTDIWSRVILVDRNLKGSCT